MSFKSSMNKINTRLLGYRTSIVLGSTWLLTLLDSVNAVAMDLANADVTDGVGFAFILSAIKSVLMAVINKNPKK